MTQQESHPSTPAAGNGGDPTASLRESDLALLMVTSARLEQESMAAAATARAATRVVAENRMLHAKLTSLEERIAEVTAAGVNLTQVNAELTSARDALSSSVEQCAQSVAQLRAGNEGITRELAEAKQATKAAQEAAAGHLARVMALEEQLGEVRRAAAKEPVAKATTPTA